MEAPARQQKTGKRRRWGGLRQQWQLLGLFQIDEQHEFYQLTCMMKQGLATAIQSTGFHVPSDFTLETFAGPAFASLRGRLGMTEQEYQQSLCSEHCYLQFISNSKSRADFFLTYDIKGCEVSRWTEPAPEESHIIVVLKDLNFEGQFITLNQQRSWLLRQVEIDTQFLRRLNVLDYSLLLAHQPLHWDERHLGHSFANIIIRTKRSVIPSYSPKHPVASVPGEVPEEDVGCEKGRTLTGDAPVAEAVFPECTVPCTDTIDLLDYQAQNRRLLPNLKNPLHVIDGPEQRYFIGIIDIFTVYSFKKRLEHWWKSLRHPGKSFSTVSPNTYCTRLQRWVQDHTK
uniref:PIPK domain-containing protein n=1 Tax=Knipowitschia caucasica TaxID=637954 RepID=A0AAV2IZ72_KNICA